MDRSDPETGEQRWHAIGVIVKGLFVVVHVYREYINGEEIIRIISARKADKKERRRYLEQAAD